VRVLLDENVPFDLARELTEHDVFTVQALGWSGVKNGELLRRAAAHCDVFLTMDSNLEHQQTLAELPFGVLIVRARSNRMVHLAPLVPAIQAALQEVSRGEIRRVGG